MVKRRTHVIALAATKGGVGKTTLASALAVRASEESKRVALIDMDTQPSLSSWWDRRGQPTNPKLFDGVDAVSEAVELIISQRFEWVFIDTPPGSVLRIEPVIASADFVLVPLQASALDVEAVGPVVDLCRDKRKPFAVVINRADPRWKLTKTTISYLRSIGCDVLEPVIASRLPYAAAMTVGKSAAELKDDGAKAEIDALWGAVTALVKG
jgi:chromosome partitioning protein